MFNQMRHGGCCSNLGVSSSSTETSEYHRWLQAGQAYLILYDSICKTVTLLTPTNRTIRSGKISQFITILSARNAVPKCSGLLTANVLNSETQTYSSVTETEVRLGLKMVWQHYKPTEQTKETSLRRIPILQGTNSSR